MRDLLRLLLFIFALLLFRPPASFSEVPVPALYSHVTDTISLLNPTTKDGLERSLKTFEETKGTQVTVLIINSTEGEAIEQFSLRVAEKWKIGRKKVDDGVILVVAKADRALRVEVGYGLEGALPDATCKQIIENYILPRFREGDFNSGIELGVQTILKRLSGEELPPPAPKNSDEWVVYLIIAIWLAIVIYQLTHPTNGRIYTSGRNSNHWGGMGGSGWSGGGGGGGFSGGGGSFGGGGASGKW